MENKNYDFVILCTTVPYDNNYFFDGDGNRVILSFHGWNLITDLPVSNGLVYFLASMACNQLGVGETHETDTGCINDFWWDKSRVDVGMRAAFICGDCLQSYEGKANVIPDVQRLLDLVSSASRVGKDVMNVTPVQANPTEKIFDVFLCHNGEDKIAIRKLNEAFRSAGIETWLDEEQLALGVPWQRELEKQIGSVRAACVFVGKNGIGPWQEAEMRGFLSAFVNRGCPVIPIILPDASVVPKLPLFLEQMTWVDLRKDYKEGVSRLVKALHRK
jgi:hypothetical protein